MLDRSRPLVLSVAITGGMHTKKANPNLPELIDEQVQQVYDAYNAGAVLVHIHTRDPENPAQMSMDPNTYMEINARIREKCPDIIINNTAICGRNIVPEQGIVTPTKDSLLDTYAEVSSVDISNYFSPHQAAGTARCARPRAGHCHGARLLYLPGRCTGGL